MPAADLRRGGRSAPELLATTASPAPASSPATAAQDTELTSLEATERQTILQAIQRVNGNLAQAARTLGISRSTLYRKVERYQLEDVVKACTEGAQ